VVATVTQRGWAGARVRPRARVQWLIEGRVYWLLSLKTSPEDLGAWGLDFG
jgi:hypothetical protein